jgi:hypothetical protein
MMNQKSIGEWQAKFGYGLLKKVRTPAFKRVSPELDQ